MLYFGRLLPTFWANATEATTNIHVNKKKNSILPLVLLLHHKYTKSICGGNANGNTIYSFIIFKYCAFIGNSVPL